jgi:hypothetical protein
MALIRSGHGERISAYQIQHGRHNPESGTIIPQLLAAPSKVPNAKLRSDSALCSTIRRSVIC